MMTFGQWQPIDTAPRDGTEILIWESKWSRGFNGEVVLEPGGSVKLAYYDKRTFGEVWTFDGEYTTNIDNPSFTHWMPLPDGPT